MFTEEETEALVLGARIVRRFADPALQSAAADALDKIETVLPERLKSRVKESALFALNFQRDEQATLTLGRLRQAVREHRIVRLRYQRADGEHSQRIVWPLCLAFVPPKWMLSGWCQLRDSFRTFRLERIADLDVLHETFEDGPGANARRFPTVRDRRRGARRRQLTGRPVLEPTVLLACFSSRWFDGRRHGPSRR